LVVYSESVHLVASKGCTHIRFLISLFLKSENMKYLYLFILLSFSNIIIGQSNRYDWDQTNYINNGSRSQIITLLKDSTLVNGIVVFNSAELQCENGKIISETHYWRNGNISSYYELKDGLYHGKSVLYYKNGNKSLVGKYAYGEFDGLGRGYRKNGLLYFEEFHEDGFLIAGRYYDKKGNLKREESTLKSITMAKLGIDIFSEEAIDFERNKHE
jgi:antitoxin component YwqK of YwqJK toxin-antitoxin module